MAPNPFAMTAAELAAFLAEPRYMACTTMKRDGSPVTVFMGFEWDGQALYFSVRNSRVLVRRLARDPRVWAAVTNEASPARFALLHGVVEVIEDPRWERTLRMFHKYMSPENDFQTEKDVDLDGFLEGYFEVGRTVYRVVPTDIRSEDGGKWAPGAAGVSDSDVAGPVRSAGPAAQDDAAGGVQ
jgi:PPOX class probable F420-dependent enzyme